MLIEGSIGVYSRGNATGEPNLMLSPGQKAVINTAVRVETVDTLPYRAWDEDAIDFRNIRMDRLLAVIAK